MPQKATGRNAYSRIMSSTRQPNMIILAGPNGSGKTTFATLLLQHEWGEGCININADALAQKLGNWNDPVCTMQAQQLAQELLKQALRILYTRQSFPIHPNWNSYAKLLKSGISSVCFSSVPNPPESTLIVLLSALRKVDIPSRATKSARDIIEPYYTVQRL